MSKSLMKAVEILDCFIDNNQLTLNELVEKTKQSKTTVFRLTSSLIEAGLLIKEKKSSHDVIFRLSLKFLTYGKKVNEQLEYKEVAYPLMKELNEELNELVHLTAREDDEAVYVETCYSTRSVRLVVNIGARIPLYAGSAPKVLLAYADEEYRKDYLKRVVFDKITKNTIDTKEKLLKEIVKIKGNGYSTSHSECFENTHGFSFPVFNHEGKIIAAIGISIPSHEYTEEKGNLIVEKLGTTAFKISEKLGYRLVL